MFTLHTYSPKVSHSQFAFFILNKGMNSGKPLDKPCPNCFVCHTSSLAEREHYYWLTYGLWQSKAFHPYLIGSVIPFIRVGDLDQVIGAADRAARADHSRFLQHLEALRLLDLKEKQFRQNLLLIADAKRVVLAICRNRQSY